MSRGAASGAIEQARRCQMPTIQSQVGVSYATLITPLNPHSRLRHMEAESFFRPLAPYLDAFVEHDAARRLALLEQGLVPSAEICGPARVFAGYAQISEKIDGFHKNWPNCRLVVASGMVCFRNAGHFAKAIVSADGSILASGHSVVELAADGRIQRVLAFWGPAPAIPEGWLERLSVPTKRAGSNAV